MEMNEKVAERFWTMMKMIEKDAELLGKKGEVRMTDGRGGPLIASPRKTQQPLTKAIFAWPYNGLQMTIPAVR